VDELYLTPLELIERITALIPPSRTHRHHRYFGVLSEPQKRSPARGPPLWEDCGDAQQGEGTQIEPDWDLAAQPAPDYEVDQRITW
jgi:Putative transposase